MKPEIYEFFSANLIEWQKVWSKKVKRQHCENVDGPKFGSTARNMLSQIIMRKRKIKVRKIVI